jgi:hypothetical protein
VKSRVDITDACEIVESFHEIFWLNEYGVEESKTEMNQSFYREENLEFLYFQRPGTASQT